MVDQVVRELELDAYTRIQSRRLSRETVNGSAWRRPCNATLSLIVLDEPSNALSTSRSSCCQSDPRRRGDGAGILVSSHHLDEVARIADLITVMNRGQLIGTLDPHTADLEHAFFTAVHADDQAHR